MFFHFWQLLSHQSLLEKDIELQNTHIFSFKSPRNFLQVNTLIRKDELGPQLKDWYATASFQFSTMYISLNVVLFCFIMCPIFELWMDCFIFCSFESIWEFRHRDNLQKPECWPFSVNQSRKINGSFCIRYWMLRAKNLKVLGTVEHGILPDYRFVPPQTTNQQHKRTQKYARHK